MIKTLRNLGNSSLAVDERGLIDIRHLSKLSYNLKGKILI